MLKEIKIMPNEPDDYDDGDEDSLRSKDSDREPGDPGWLGDED